MSVAVMVLASYALSVQKISLRFCRVSFDRDCVPADGPARILHSPGCRSRAASAPRESKVPLPISGTGGVVLLCTTHPHRPLMMSGAMGLSHSTSISLKGVMIWYRTTPGAPPLRRVPPATLLAQRSPRSSALLRRQVLTATLLAQRSPRTPARSNRPRRGGERTQFVRLRMSGAICNTRATQSLSLNLPINPL